MQKKGMKNLSELAQKIGLSYESLRKIFNRNDCKLSTLLKISEVLGCNVADLIK